MSFLGIYACITLKVDNLVEEQVFRGRLSQHRVGGDVPMRGCRHCEKIMLIHGRGLSDRTTYAHLKQFISVVSGQSAYLQCFSLFYVRTGIVFIKLKLSRSHIL